MIEIKYIFVEGEEEMRIHAFINYAVADLGSIEQWAKDRGHSISTTAVFEKETFPDIHSFDMLVILGGMMGAYEEDEYPWLFEEKQCIRQAIESKKIVLGICLGAQLIAEALGGKAYPHMHHEIGWWDVRFEEKVEQIPLFHHLPRKLKFFQYHGDTFDLPEGARWLAESDGCKNQVFLYGDRVLGLQFHPEFREQKLQEIVALHGDTITEGPYTQLPAQFLGKQENMHIAKQFLFQLLDNLEKNWRDNG